jgi:hypothetical protein
MAHTPPTPEEFKTRFPVFASETDERVQIFLSEAERNIDDTWEEDDYAPAIMYLAAHLLKTENDAGSSGGSKSATGPISSESFAGMSRSYDTSKLTAAQKSIYGGTLYGQRYYVLLLKNKPSIMVVF